MDGIRQLSNCVSTHEHLPCRLCGYDEQPSTEQPASAAGSETDTTDWFADCREGNHAECMYQYPDASSSVNTNNVPYMLTCTCPHHGEQPAPAAQETGEWRVERRESRAVVVNGNGEHVAFGCGNYTSERLQRAEQIVHDHNEHQSLSAEREKLIVAASRVVERLQDLPRFLEKNGTQTLADIAAECLADLVVAIPAPHTTTERG